jgi:deoxyribodipyrimidine photo-lyase
MLGTHFLRFGAVSIRKMVDHAASSKCPLLIWENFFMQILWHFPHTANSSFLDQNMMLSNGKQWRVNKWCQGKTYYPTVDAGMRELNKTGHMHNRKNGCC